MPNKVARDDTKVIPKGYGPYKSLQDRATTGRGGSAERRGTKWRYALDMTPSDIPVSSQLDKFANVLRMRHHVEPTTKQVQALIALTLELGRMPKFAISGKLVSK